MADKRMSIKEVRETARTLEESLKSTIKGLELFQQALERGGFKAAVAPYQQMQHVLLQQRLWSVDYGRDVLNPLWKDLSRRAGAIHAILAPFTGVMGTLKDLDRVYTVKDAPAPKAEPAPPPVPDATLKALAALLLDDVAISTRRQARGLDLPEDERRARLQALAEAGLLERHGWGWGQSYRLTPKARAALAARLAEQLAAPPARPTE